VKKEFSIIVIIVAAIAIISGCRKKTPEQSAGMSSQKVAIVSAIQAIEGSISKTLELTGSVTATKVARMGSPAEGPVLQCKVREGDEVTAGQVLLTIGRKKAADALVEAAKDALGREQDELKRTQKLVESGAIPADEMEVANLRVSRATAELSKALESVGDYRIEAPLDGMVSKVFVTDGYYVSPREHLVEIYDPASQVLEFAVPESQIAVMYKGMSVEIQLDAYPDEKFKGEVNRIYPELNRRTRTRTAEAKIMGENSTRLLPGMFARIKLVIETVEKAVLIPDKAIVLTPANAQLVFVVNGQTAQARKVKLGLEQGRMVQILDGVRPGEMVITEGNERLKDGASVKIMGSEKTKKMEPSPTGKK
jgi:membrane fusion protein (multidrug efflux system)